MEDLGVARGSIELDLGKMNSTIATAVQELQKVEQASKKTDSEIAVLQSTSNKTGNAFDEAAKKAQTLANHLETAKSKVEVYEKEIGVLKTQLIEGQKAQETLAKTISETKGKYDEAKKAVEELDRRYKESRESLASIKQTHEQNNQALKTAKQAVQDYAKQLTAANRESKSYTSEIAKLEKEQAKLVKEQESLNKKIATAKEKYVQSKKAVEDLDFELTNAKASMYKLEKQYGTTSDATKQAREAVEKYEKELSDANEALAKHQKDLISLVDTQDANKKKYEEVGKAIETAKAKYKEASDAASDLAKSQGDATSELEAAQKAYEASAKSVEDAKSETKGYKEQLDEAKNTARDYAQEVNDLESKQRSLGNEMKTAEGKLEQFETECNYAKADVNELSIELANTKSKAQQFGQYMEDAGEKLQNIGSKIESFGNKLTTHVTTPLVTAGTAATKWAGDLEQSLASVETIADTSAKSMSTIKQEIRDTSDELGVSAKDVSDAYYQIISATADTENAVELVDASMRLKIAGNVSDATATADVLTTIINAYKLQLTDAESVSDKLFETTRLGKTTMAELSSSLGSVVPVAANAGVSLDELLSDLIVLTRNGLSTDMAVTALRGALTSIISPSEEAKEVTGVLGVAWNAATLESKGFTNMLADLGTALDNTEPKYAALSGELDSVNQAMATNNDAMTANQARIEELEEENRNLQLARDAEADSVGTSSQRYKDLGRQMRDNKTEITALSSANSDLQTENKNLQKSADGLSEQLDILAQAADSTVGPLADIFGNVRGLTGVLSIKSSLDDVTDSMDDLKNSTGATNKALGIMQGTNASKLNRSLNRLKNTAIDAGEKIAPVVADVVDHVADLIGKFSELDEETQKQILTAAGIAAAAGPVTKVLGGITSAVGGVVGGIGSLVKSVSTVTSVGGTVIGTAEGVVGATGSVTGALGSKGLSGVLAGLATPGVGWAVVAAAAIAGIGFACKAAYDQAVQYDLAEHFGTVKLTAEEAADIAKRITAEPWVVELEAHSNVQQELKLLEGNIQATMADINKNQWKISMGIELTDEEKEAYKSSLDSYAEEMQEYINNKHYAANLAITAVYGGDNEKSEKAKTFADELYDSLSGEVETAASDLAELTNKAYENDLFDEPYTAHLISRKIDEINSAKKLIDDAEYKLKLHNIQGKYGGTKLTADSFKQLQKEVNDLMEERKEQLESAKYDAQLGVQVKFETAEIDQSEYDRLMNEIELESSHRLGEVELDGLTFEMNNITMAYTPTTKKNAEEMAGEYADIFKTGLNKVANGELKGNDPFGFNGLWDVLYYQFNNGLKDLSPESQAAIAQLVENLQPTKAQLEEIRNKYVALGEDVPEDISNGLRNITLWEAMTGDVSAVYGLLADAIANDPELGRAFLNAKDAGLKLNDNFMGSVDFADVLRQKYPEIYDAAMGADEETARGIRDGSYYTKKAAQETVDDVHDIVDGANGGTIQIKTTNPADLILAAIDKIKRALSAITINLPIKFNAGGIGGIVSRLAGYSEGGIVTQAQVATVAEGNKAEAIIPLAASQRANALELYSQVGNIIGATPYNINTKGGDNTDALATAIAGKLAMVLKEAPIQNNVSVEMADGDVIIDKDKVGRKIAPVVSRVQATRL